MATQMSNFGLMMDQVTGSAPGHKAGEVQLYASSSTNEAGTTQLFMKDSAGTEFVVGGSWKLEDGDGTELAISGGAQVKFAEGNGGVDINWTDVSHGVDGDEYDLTFTLDLNGVAAAAVDVANDSIAIIDANDSNGTKKESVADLVSAVAGTVTTTGLAASSGVLKLDIQNMTAATAVADADLVVIDDGAGGTLRKMTRAHFIESAALDAINIDGGAIDGAAIGANDPSTIVGTTITVNTALLPDSSGGADLGSTSAELGDVYIADDKKIYFGNDQDASIEYDEDGQDVLSIAGADVLIADDKKLFFGAGKDASFEYDEDGTDTLLYAGASMRFSDDVKLEFGAGGDASFEYDEDGNDVLLYAGANMRFGDDIKLEFGAGGDATIEYDEDGTDELRFAGAAVTFEQAVSMDANVTLGNAAGDVTTVTGKLTGSNGMHISGLSSVANMLVRGELQVQGAINTVTNHETELHIADKVILIASGTSKNDGAAALNALDAGGLYLGSTGSLAVAAIKWDAGNDRWHTDEGMHVSGALLVGGASSLNGAVTLGDATGDDVVITGRIAADIDPKTDNTYDLGAASLQWKDLYVNGIGYIDQLGTDADPSAAYISSGEIDGTVIGGESAAAATFTTVNVNTALLPDSSGGADLGSASKELGDVYIADDKKIYFGNDQDASIEYDEDGQDVLSIAGADVLIADDKKLYFGAGKDASLEYDEDGTDELRFAGAAVTFEQNVSMDSNVTLGLDANDVVTVAGELTASLGLSIPDDKKLYFGNGFDASFEYDEDGNDVLLYAGANMRFSDDVKLEFGAAGDAGIEYDEDGSDQLRIHAPAAGVVIAGATPSLTIGDAGAEDTKLVFDGNAQDFYMGLDDGTDSLMIGLGSAVGTTPNMTLASANRNVQFHGNVQVDGNNLVDNAGNAVISFDGSGNGGFNANMTVGGGYGSSGVTVSSAGAIQANSSLTVDEGATFGGGYGSTGVTISNAGALSANGMISVGSDGAGANFKAHGAAANEFMSYDKDTNLLQLNGSDGNTIVSIGGDAAGEFAIDVPTGATNKHKIRAAAFVTYSDESLKQDVASMSNTALDTVMSLEGVEFTWKDSGERDFGFIAQDVHSVLPKAVHTAENGVQGVDYSRLTSVLVEAVKAQQVQIEDLKKVISNLKK